MNYLALAAAGICLASAAIVGDWPLRASISYAGGIMLGFAIARLYPLTSERTE